MSGPKYGNREVRLEPRIPRLDVEFRCPTKHPRGAESCQDAVDHISVHFRQMKRSQEWNSDRKRSVYLEGGRIGGAL
jgi:hypothetical protein